MSASLYELHKDFYKKSNQYEAAAFFFVVNAIAFPESTYVLPLSQTDLLVRAGVIMNMWANKGKISRPDADLHIMMLQTHFLTRR